MRKTTTLVLLLLVLTMSGVAQNDYFWPAMWATAFNEDDPESPQLADEMGIVMGSSHHEYLKPKEMPISFIMDYAWNPKRIAPRQEEEWLRKC